MIYIFWNLVIKFDLKQLAISLGDCNYNYDLFYYLIRLHLSYPISIQQLNSNKASILQMENFPDVFTDKTCNSLSFHIDSLTTISKEYIPIECFLNLDAVIETPSSTISNFFKQQQPKINKDESQEQSRLEEQILLERRKKSIFHNFQKHLITLIRRFINMNENTFPQGQNQMLAMKLWKAFKMTKGFNKRVLHTIFGVYEINNISQELQKLSNDFKQFKEIYDSHAVELIVKAQTIIREYVVSQVATLSKSFLRDTCNITRFQEFYQYYTSFISELRTGPMTKRMTKNRKSSVLQRLSIPEI